jgi:hypothetical protein
MLYDPAIFVMKDYGMSFNRIVVTLCAACLMIQACGATKYLKGGLYSEADDNLTIVSLMENTNKYLNKDIVFPVRFYKKGDLPCPLGDDYVNLIIADRVSYITLNKVWMKKDKARVLDGLKEMETIVMKARVFKIDREKDPNMEALEIVRE